MRSSQWDDIRGQDAAVKLLRGALRSGRVAHAYLFAGPRGVGKTTTAFVFAAGLLCTAATPDGRPCGGCDACRAVAAGLHEDVHITAPVEDKILIDQVRELQQRAMLRAVRGRHKLFLIEGADTATEQAQNALLKLLEEPPGNTVFVLVAHEQRPLLPTIVSRCVAVRFGRLTRAAATNILRDRFDYGAAAELGAALGDGSIAAATRWPPEALLERRAAAVDVLDDLLQAPLSAVPAKVDTWIERREQLLEMLDIWQVWLRDVLVTAHTDENLHRAETRDDDGAATAGADASVSLVNFDRAPLVRGWARRLHPAAIMAVLDSVLDFRRRLARNVHYRTALDGLFLDIAAAGRQFGA